MLTSRAKTIQMLVFSVSNYLFKQTDISILIMKKITKLLCFSGVGTLLELAHAVQELEEQKFGLFTNFFVFVQSLVRLFACCGL